MDIESMIKQMIEEDPSNKEYLINLVKSIDDEIQKRDALDNMSLIGKEIFIKGSLSWQVHKWFPRQDCFYKIVSVNTEWDYAVAVSEHNNYVAIDNRLAKDLCLNNPIRDFVYCGSRENMPSLSYGG